MISNNLDSSQTLLLMQVFSLIMILIVNTALLKILAIWMKCFKRQFSQDIPKVNFMTKTKLNLEKSGTNGVFGTTSFQSFAKRLKEK